MIRIEPFTLDRRAAVHEFNKRIGPSGFDYPEEPAEGHFLALEEEDVRGGYILRRQQFVFSGEAREVAHYRLPISEGIVNKAYATLGMHLLRHALKQQPMLYALGMGGLQNPLPQMLKAMGWGVWSVPFFFKVNHPARFLRNIRPLRKSAARRMLLDAAALTGAGWVGLKFVQRPVGEAARCELAYSFTPWADDIWTNAKAQYQAIAERGAATLDSWYPGEQLRIRVGLQGWALALDTQMREDQYFGNMRLGSIADCMAAPGDAPAVIRAATRFLEQRGVDLIVSNQLHHAWQNALRSAGFREGPSNFVFAASKKLAELISNPAEVHMNRGDGDGPIHL
jgi:hypothetical protein